MFGNWGMFVGFLLCSLCVWADARQRRWRGVRTKNEEAIYHQGYLDGFNNAYMPDTDALIDSAKECHE